MSKARQQSFSRKLKQGNVVKIFSNRGAGMEPKIQFYRRSKRGRLIFLFEIPVTSNI